VLRKRIIGVVTVRTGWAVQSFGYGRSLPHGHPECRGENLDRWGADEICVLSIDRSKKGLGPDFDLLDRIGHLGISTPLIYGGGIASVADAVRVVQSGADRVCLDALLHDSPSLVSAISENVGAQAIIGCLPLHIAAGGLRWLDHRSGAEKEVSAEVMELFTARIVSEVLVVDWRHEGIRRGFDRRLMSRSELAGLPLIAFGGVSEADQASEMLSAANVVAVAIGNFLSYREHAIQAIKHAGDETHLRPAEYRAHR